MPIEPGEASRRESIEMLDPPGRFRHLNARDGDRGHAGIVTAVFEPAKPLPENSVASCHRRASDDSAHGSADLLLNAAGDGVRSWRTEMAKSLAKVTRRIIPKNGLSRSQAGAWEPGDWAAGCSQAGAWEPGWMRSLGTGEETTLSDAEVAFDLLDGLGDGSGMLGRLKVVLSAIHLSTRFCAETTVLWLRAEILADLREGRARVFSSQPHGQHPRMADWQP